MDEQQTAYASPVRNKKVEPAGGGTSPLDVILQTTGGYCVARALHVAADLGIADCIGEQPAGIAEVARSVGVDADSLGRILRLLSAHGIFSVTGGDVSHNEVSRTLRSDDPKSTRDLARMFGLPFFWETFAALDHTVRTGRPAVEKVHPQGLWAWLSERPDASAVFNRAMIGKSSGQVAGVVACYDFSRFGTIADVGGGRGHLLQAILEKWPSTSGVLFEQPHVVAEVNDITSDRLTLRGGDFFVDELPVCDAHILMEVIHDWADEEALRILQAVRDAAPAGSRLLLVEQLMPETPGPHWVKMLDLHMMALFAARQRSAEEYDRLVEQCGFKRLREIDTPAGITILEYERV
ncbi:MAG: acetylserotonin O-methyltransferase [Pseudomonadota bacterium]|nr:acetylserotonin O-methyltransferase [Pseudomonadota bacterium]